MGRIPGLGKKAMKRPSGTVRVESPRRMGCCASTEDEEERTSLINPNSINDDGHWVRTPQNKTLNRPVDRLGEPAFATLSRTPHSPSIISPSRAQDGQQRVLNRIVQRTLRNFIDISQIGEGYGSVIGDGVDKTDKYIAAVDKSGGPAKTLVTQLPELSFLDDEQEPPTIGQFSRAQNDFIKLCSDSLAKALDKMDVQDRGPMTLSFSEASMSLGSGTPSSLPNRSMMPK